VQWSKEKLKELQKEIVQRSKVDGYQFEKVEIFLRVKGRLPDQDNDILTQEILDEFCRRYEEGELTQGIVPLKVLYKLIKNGEIKMKEVTNVSNTN